MKEFNLNQREIELIYPIHIIDLKGFKEFPAKIYSEKHGVTSQKDTEKLDMATSENYSAEFYAGVLNANCGKYQGMKVSEAAKQVTIDLIDENKADKIYIPVTKILKCKCGTKIIVSILKDQWFLNFNAGDWKNRAFKCLEMINITPPKYRSTFEYMFNWLEKRPCARKRGLGTSLPFNKDWIIEPLSDSTIYMAFYTISYKLREYKIEPAQLIPEFFEFVFLEKGDVKSLAKQTDIEEKILKELRTEFLYWYPVDHRHTAIMHISNHLSFFVFHHVAIFPEKHWPKIISLIEPVIVEGQKMGKSKGNVITLGTIRKEYSADVFRFYISHGADFSAYMDFREKEIKAVKANIRKFYEFTSKKIEFTKKLVPQVENVKSRYSRVMMSRISKNFINAKTALEHLNIRKYLQISFYETFRLIQDIFKNTEDEQEALQVFKIIYEEWLKILSLVIPHLCEELWEKAGQRGFISTEVWSDVSNKYIDETLETEFEYITNIIEDILNIKKIVRTQSSNNIYLYTAPVWMYKVLEIIDSEERDFKAIITTLKKDSDIMKNSQVIPFIKAQLKDNTQKQSFPQLDETLVLDQYKTYIEKRVKSAIYINSEFDPNQRALKSRPFKPGIFIDT
ncbi:MAG: class I tRNA ligase family protein [Promethearchaeota archaeon]|jgi:leucyl-tRNA synthetase